MFLLIADTAEGRLIKCIQLAGPHEYIIYYTWQNKARFALEQSMMHFCGDAAEHTCRRATKKLTKPIQSRMKSLIAPTATPPPSSGLIKRRENNIYNIMRISYHACIKFTQCAQRAAFR
jgi:hypothetical protein